MAAAFADLDGEARDMTQMAETAAFEGLDNEARDMTEMAENY